ncbi:MAG: MBL fold metallo-hydrolase [Lachnospiraceae bacterium]|nr:MBL fold metallo-hydrolase [Lachnospiraceae bacterium]MDE6981179.1 MBL fold metallo-hydrolase [Lachnospiraceae bacterium]
MKKRFISPKTAAAFFALFLLLGITGCQETLSTESNHKTPHAKTTAVSPDDNFKDSPGQLSVHYIDVGQGDATLITCGEDAMLIDAGDNNKGTALQSYLLSQNVKELDYVIGTHPDADHIGGLDVVITKFDCGTILLTEEEKDTKTYEDVISAMDYKGYKKTLPVPGDTYALGDASFTILAPVSINEDSNDNSIALLLTYGTTRFYFEGDAGEEEEEQILSSGANVAADVYKIGHHGSKTSTTDDMLHAVNPSCAVISAGENNRYGHPHGEVLNKLRSAGIKTFRTDEEGTVVAKSDGNNIVFNMSPSDTWQAGEPGNISDREPAEKGTLDSGEGKIKKETEDSYTGDNGAVIVYITDTGEKYHRDTCRFVKDGSREISLDDAQDNGYEPCKVCRPPQ